MNSYSSINNLSIHRGGDEPSVGAILRTDLAEAVRRHRFDELGVGAMAVPKGKKRPRSASARSRAAATSDSDATGAIAAGLLLLFSESLLVGNELLSSSFKFSF